MLVFYYIMPYKDPEKEQERQRRRRETPEYKKYQREYQKGWRLKNPDKVKAIRNKAEKNPKRREYISNWWKNNPKAKAIRKRFNESIKAKEYYKKWNMENPEKLENRYAKYYASIKGVVNRLKKNEARKFKGNVNNITIDLIEMVDKRDKNCVYCGKKLPEKPMNRNDIHYDHINPFKPFSEINIVRCCGSCNHQKSNADVLQWCEYKGYKPAKIVCDLLEKNRGRQKLNCI